MVSKSKPAIFISHAAKDSQFARALSDALEKRGFGAGYVRLARTEEPVQKELTRALEQASVYLFLVSDDAVRSSWMFFELGAALGKGKAVLPVYFSESAWRRARSFLPSISAEVRPINAHDLKPAEVADKVVEALETVAA